MKVKLLSTISLSIFFISAFSQTSIERAAVIKENQTKTQPTKQVNKNNQVSTQYKPVEQINVVKPATRTNTPKIVETIDLSNDPSISQLDNLVNHIEQLENVNQFGTDKIKSSNEYSELVSLVQNEKQAFKTSVKSKGFLNCSTREQNYFLSFLKEEGNDIEFKKYASQLK